MQVIVVDANPVNLRLMENLVRRADDYSPMTFQEAGAGLAWCLNNALR